MKGIYFLELDDDMVVEDGDDDPQISLLAMTGINSGGTIQLATTVANATMTALIDSGSKHCFMGMATADRLGLSPSPRPGMTVGVANGERVPTFGVCPATPIRIGNELFTVVIYIIPLQGYELVLGCQWLRTLGPILWDFYDKSMAFWRTDHHVKWFSVDANSAPRLSALAARDLMSLLLTEFSDIFEEPVALPPQRFCDHRIHLLPETAPVVVRPYRYPQLLKDEIERQCTEMLRLGVIHASTSSFSSPVLLVRKKDGSWRFCVDYRALNAKTVRDVFPIPVVDELLDELQGARFFTKLDLRV